MLPKLEAALHSAPDLAPEALISAIEETAEALPQHPYLYRHGRVLGTRE